MATKPKKQKINFNKFFPDSDSYVTLSGIFDPSAENIYDILDMNLTIQNGTRSAVNFFTWLTDSNGETLKQLKAIQEATAKAIKIIEEAEALKKERKKATKKEPIVVAPRVTKQRK